MKIALYIEDSLEQIVLTPESDMEKSILGKVSDAAKSGERELSIYRGTFYACRGGWVRHRQPYSSPYGDVSGEDESTIIVLQPKEIATDKYEGPTEPDGPHDY